MGLTRRIAFHMQRFRGEWLYGAIFGTVFALLIGAIYPGESGVQDIFKLLNEASFSGIFGGLDVNSPGWLLWISIYLGLITYYVLAITGINIGSRIVPTTEEDASEVLLGYNPFSPRKFYLENYLAAILTQLGILLPIYIITIIFSITVYDSNDILGKLILTMLISLCWGIFFLSLTSLFTILSFSKKIGKIVGFGYLFYAFIFEILSETPEYVDYGDLSVHKYLQAISILFDNFDTTPLFVVLSLSILFVIIGFWRVKHPDFIEKAHLFRGRKFPNPFSFLTNTISPSSRLARKYPLFTDQFRLDIRSIFVVLGFIIFQQSVIFLTLPDPSQLVSALEASQNPALSAFSQNHETPASFLGFIVLKFYTVTWLFYGIVIAVIASSIATRDVRTNTHDLIFANDISPKRLVLERLTSMFVTFTIIVWGSFGYLQILQSGRVDIDFMTQLGLFIVLWVHYLGLGILLIGISMLPLIGKGRNLAMSIFTFFIIFSFIPFMNSSIEFLKYLSYLSYFDPVGMIYGIIDFWPSFAISSVLFVLSSVFTWYMTTRKFVVTDLR